MYLALKAFIIEIILADIKNYCNFLSMLSVLLTMKTNNILIHRRESAEEYF